MAIDKALGQAPMGLNDQLIPPPDDMFSGIEIEIEDPEAVRIGIDGMPILEIEAEEVETEESSSPMAAPMSTPEQKMGSKEGAMVNLGLAMGSSYSCFASLWPTTG